MMSSPTWLTFYYMLLCLVICTLITLEPMLQDTGMTTSLIMRVMTHMDIVYTNS